MRKVGMISVWLLATLMITGLTWQIVSAAEGRVSDGPVVELSLSGEEGAVPQVSTTLFATDSTTPTSSSTSTSLSGSTSTLAGSSSSVGTTGGPGTTAVPGTTASTSPASSSSTSSPSSTSTTSAGAWVTASIPTIGGTVVVQYRGDEAKLVSATPALGFGLEVDKPGPPEVRIDFNGIVTTVEVRIRSDNGVLDIEVDEDS